MSLFDKTEKLVREPKVLNVLMYPNPFLEEVSSHVTTSIPDDTELQDLLSDMKATLTYYAAQGLAAIQVGVPLRVLLVRDPSGEILTVINPRLTFKDSEPAYENEGCLSLPGVFTRIVRPKTVHVEYFNEKGEKVTKDADGILARAIMHEVDHLDGKTFLTKMTSVQRASALNRLKKAKRKMF
jgi:peptide deformylase